MKRRIKIRDIHLFEHEVLQEYFHKMALQGWMIVKAKRLWFVFEKCEPQEVSFFFDIYEQGNYLDPNDINEEQIAYSDFIEQYDYELITRSSNYQLYKRMDPSQIPIHTIEDKHRMHRHYQSIKRYELYNYVLLALVFTCNFWLTKGMRITTLTSNLQLFLSPLLLLITILAWLRCIPFFIWLFKKERYHIAVNMFEIREKFYAIIYGITIMLSILFLCFLSAIPYLVPICIILFIFSLSFYLFDALLKHKCKRTHTILSMLIAFYLSYLGGIHTVFHYTTPYSLTKTKDASAYIRESVLLRYDQPKDASYSIYTIKAAFAREYIIDTLLYKNYHTYTYQTSFEGWEVYRDEDFYLFIKKDTIVELNTHIHDEIQQAELSKILAEVA